MADQQFDVFLSYNTHDHEVVERVRRWLKDQGLTCFTDRTYLVPGQPWPKALEKAIDASGAVAVFLGSAGTGRWQDRELYLALDRHTKTKLPVIPVLLPGADAALGFLSLHTWVDLSDPVNESRQLQILAAAIRGLSPAELETEFEPQHQICPFRGLLPYREQDAPLFFGREVYTQQLVDAVAAHSIIAVVGASGSGKSSVVRAGLVPELRESSESVYEIATLVPTSDPLTSLARTLLPLIEPEKWINWSKRDRDVETEKYVRDFREKKGTLRRCTEHVLDAQPGTDRLLLVVDQWEELYTQAKDPAAAKTFIDQLLEATIDSPLRVVFTCRGDFYGRVISYRPLTDRIQRDAHVALGPMGEDELGSVIKRPAEETGLQYEEGLVRRILDDVGSEPGGLPLLSFLLEELWKHRRGNGLTHEAYDAVGGVQGAMSKKAEDLYAELDGNRQKELQRIFMRLVSIGDQSELTRRREDLSHFDDNQKATAEHFIQARLLTTSYVERADDQAVEVAHEALIDRWDRLKDWAEESNDFLRWRQRLEMQVEQWLTQGRDQGALLRGGPLVEAEDWLAKHSSDLSDEQIEFIQASISERAAELERQQKINSRLRKLSAVAVSLALIGVIAAGVAGWKWSEASAKAVEADTQRGIAEYKTRIADTVKEEAIAEKSRADMEAERARRESRDAHRQLVSTMGLQAQLMAEERPVSAMLMAVRAIGDARKFGIEFPAAAEQAFRDRLQGLGGVALTGQNGPIWNIAIGPNGRWLVTGSRDGTARLWDLTAEQPETTARVLAGHDGSIGSVAIGPNGRWLVTGSDDATARLHALDWRILIDDAYRAVGRNFTKAEWNDLFPGEEYDPLCPFGDLSDGDPDWPEPAGERGRGGGRSVGPIRQPPASAL
ncbi:nSTAND1 domain-containing NTPase [Stratiformator vulcanicus]|uniref:WD domain, G-beta repeat n=1 Tax=Stratiformator vulcanicus TaxID=2527980 RepID=A0A517QWJ5_9PLAN|nr:TIR domain-containing protein [Stratiformator vulcanicus]QDT35974.1 WD domain, G-beta repeat [Stratiformator vulcanicus]